jgi:hypothetical protein
MIANDQEESLNIIKKKFYNWIILIVAQLYKFP